MAFPRQLVALRAASVFERTHFSNDSTGEGGGREFNSLKTGAETRGRVSAAQGENSTTKQDLAKSVETRCCERKEWRVSEELAFLLKR